MFRTVNVNEISKDVQIRKRSDLRNEVWDILMSKRDQQEVTSEMGGKPAECVILDAKWGKRINEQEEQFSYTFDLKCVGNLKSLFQKKLYQSFFFFFTETSHGRETASSQMKTPVPICMWSHEQSFPNLAVLLAVTFPTPPRGPGNSVRLATPEVGLIRSFSASSYSRNKRKWRTLGINPEML